MDIRQGDRVLVNLAPFIGSRRRCAEFVPCRVVAVDSTHVAVNTEFPLREVFLCVQASWIERTLESDLRTTRCPSATEARQATMGVVG